MPEILHLVEDKWFMDAAYKLFEAANPGQNRYVLLEPPHPLAYPKQMPITCVSPWSLLIPGTIKRILGSTDIVIFHMMSRRKLFFLKFLPKHVVTLWIGAGGDYYHKGNELHDYEGRSMLLPKTRQLNTRLRSKGRILYRKVLKFIVEEILLNQTRIKSRITFFSPVLPLELDVLKRAIPSFQPRLITWNYGTLEDDVIRGHEEKSIHGDAIFIGNSATATSNHIEALDILKTCAIGTRNILVPLSYGDTDYAHEVVTYGHSLFGPQFKPILDYMKLEDYVTLLASCSVAIMNHLSQQAVGNILIMLHLGAKVFLDASNPTYTHFQQQGFHIFTTASLPTEMATRLSSQQVAHNRALIRQHWSRDVMQAKTRTLLQTLADAAKANK